MSSSSTSSKSERQKKAAPLWWASGSTLLLHGAFLAALWFWPQTPPRAEEKLLEVDLKDEPAKTTPPEPTPTSEKPKSVATTPPPTPVPQPTRVPEPTPVPQPTPTPKLAKETRVKRVLIAAKPTPIPEKKEALRPVEKAVKPERAPKPIMEGTTKVAPRSKPRPFIAKRPAGGSGSPRKDKRSDSPSPSSGGSPRRLARLPEPERSTRRLGSETPPASGGGGPKRTNETAGSLPGLDLPRTQTRRGRRSDKSGDPSSAPIATKDGTEVNIGPSSPSSSSGGSRRVSMDFGEGDDNTGRRRRSGPVNGQGTGTSSTGRSGSGGEEAPGLGTGSGIGNSGGRTRRGSRMAGDPYGTKNGGGGPGSTGNGGGGSGSGTGSGNGPGNGTRLARRNFGDGDGDGTGGGNGRGPGVGGGSGPGTSPGAGSGNGTGGGVPGGRGDGEIAGGEPGSGGRSRRERGARRTGDAEDQMGRGIWGGFKINYYQDKADHPDLPDATFFPGNPIDWPVFSKLVTRKTVPNLDFDWGETPPAAGMKSTFWSLKANGRIFVPKDDTYEFFFDELDDAGKLILDGKTIIEVWKVQKSSPSSAKMFLTRGPHDIQIQYIQGPATAASIKLSWRSTSFPKEIVGVYKAPEER